MSGRNTSVFTGQAEGDIASENESGKKTFFCCSKQPANNAELCSLLAVGRACWGGSRVEVLSFKIGYSKFGKIQRVGGRFCRN